MRDQDEESPISFLASITRLPARGMPVVIEADEDQRKALAGMHDLVAVNRLRADLVVATWKRDGVKVTGKVEAEIVQECIVTLAPIESRLSEEIHALFVPEGSKLARPDVIEGGELLLDAEGEDAPEVFTGDKIDVGRLAEEFFTLGIDPYPRKPGAEAPLPDGDGEPIRGPLYEKLKALKRGS